MKKRISFIISLALILASLIIGIAIKDYEEVEFNANILCLSCIGIE